MKTRLNWITAAALVSSAVSICGCDQSASSSAAVGSSVGRAAAYDEQFAPMPAPEDADLRILFIGNSHTAYHQLTQRIRALLEAANDDHSVYVAQSIGGFLAGQAESDRTLSMINEVDWDYVVLQAQKYSQSGEYTYPHDGAITLTAFAHERGATVLMYPEWGQRGRDGEGERIHALHEQIAAETGAQVVPVGRAWDRALAENPEFTLHASDGNHASSIGAYLTACVFACWLSGSELTAVGNAGAPSGVDHQTRTTLQRIAWETVDAHRATNSEPTDE